MQRRLGLNIFTREIKILPTLYSLTMTYGLQVFVHTSDGAVDGVVAIGTGDIGQHWFSSSLPTAVELERDTNSRSNETRPLVFKLRY